MTTIDWTLDPPPTDVSSRRCRRSGSPSAETFCRLLQRGTAVEAAGYAPAGALRGLNLGEMQWRHHPEQAFGLGLRMPGNACRLVLDDVGERCVTLRRDRKAPPHGCADAGRRGDPAPEDERAPRPVGDNAEGMGSASTATLNRRSRDCGMNNAASITTAPKR